MSVLKVCVLIIPSIEGILEIKDFGQKDFSDQYVFAVCRVKIHFGSYASFYITIVITLSPPFVSSFE